MNFNSLRSIEYCSSRCRHNITTIGGRRTGAIGGLTRLGGLVAVCLFAVLGCSASTVRAADLDAAIAKHRMGTLTIKAQPGQAVTVEQQRHEFWFGAALSSGPFSSRSNSEDAARYKQVFLANFNAAVTENALKWHAMEPQRGKIDYQIVDAILQWTEEHAIPLRGHNIFWGVPNRVQDWQQKLDDQALREALRTRALDISRRYRGRFAEYDLNNEMIHANYYEQRLGPGITQQMAQWVKEGDPDAVLYLNDYDILTGRMLDRYVAQIRALRDQDVPIGGIGVQGHLHGDSFDSEALQSALDTLGQFDLPIRVTEFNFPGQRSRYMRDRRARMTPAQEEAKAQALVDYYRICFAHPAVEGILMWGFWEGANWIPASSLYRRDWTPTPAAEAYRDLVYKRWWTTWQGQVGPDGSCQVRAFYGKYRIRADEKEKTVELKRAAGSLTVEF